MPSYRLFVMAISLTCVFTASTFQSNVLAFDEGEQDTVRSAAIIALSRFDTRSRADLSDNAEFISDVCAQIERTAQEENLPAGFLAKLIWKESRFDPNAISPAGAEGIAQFMPYTAANWELENAFEPLEAIAASSRLLGHLARGYGNLGLAAAAYNAGEARVDAWRAGRSGLPGETRDYVYSITGHPAKSWKKGAGPEVNYRLDETRKFQTACEEFRQVMAPLQRRFANTYFNRALSLAQNGDHEGALLRYSVAIRLKPNFAHAYNNRGLVYRKLGQFENAIENYSVAIRKAPNYANAYNNRGFANRKLKRYRAAIEDYSRAIALNPAHATAWFNRGFSKAKLGLFDEALEDYSQSIKLKSGSPLVLYNRALAYRALGQSEQAKGDLDIAIAAHGTFARAYFQRAKLLLDLGEAEQAKSDYLKSVALDTKFGHEKYRVLFE